MRDITLHKPERATAAERQASRRDRHGWRTADKTNKFGTATHAKEKADAKRHENEVRAETRRKVWLRSAVCECCGDTEQQTAGKWHKATHEAHEVISRAQTRGMAPEYRFSTENTARLCCECHRLFTRNRRAFQFQSDLRMDGPFSVVIRY